jgi:hypothetical protein
MFPKFTFIIIGLSLLSTIVGSILFALGYENDFVFILAEGGNNLGLLLGFAVLVINGSLLKTKYWLLILAGFILLLVGELTKILHWNYSNILLMVGVCVILISYFLRFINKQEKGHLDILKLLWVIAYFGNYILNILIFSLHNYDLIPIIILWITIIDFMVLEIKKEEILEQ